MKKIQLVIIYLFYLNLFPVDVTATRQYLGNPFTNKGAYARNIWDMQQYNGRIYFGHGNCFPLRFPAATHNNILPNPAS